MKLQSTSLSPKAGCTDSKGHPTPWKTEFPNMGQPVASKTNTPNLFHQPNGTTNVTND